MKITRLRAFHVPLPLREGFYSWGSQSYAAFDSTVVLLDTDEGLTGVGEVCPLGPAYMPSFADGARAAMAVMAAGLMGVDPRAVDVVNHRMDELLKGTLTRNQRSIWRAGTYWERRPVSPCTSCSVGRSPIASGCFA